MKRTPAESILGEWGVRDVTPPSQVERARLERDRDLNPLLGKARRSRVSPFRVEADRYLAALGGPLPYMLRLRRIEVAESEILARARELRARSRDASAWHGALARIDFTEINELIDEHNRYYPIEARLPMDPRSRDYVTVGGRSYRRKPIDTAWVIEQLRV